MKIHVTLITIICSFFTMSCSNMSSVSNATPEMGISKLFNTDAQRVNVALLATLQNMNVHIKESKQTENGFRILFTKSISAFSWGEVGRALVIKGDGNTSRVYIHTLKRGALQFTGAEPEDFSSVIFTEISIILKEQLV